MNEKERYVMQMRDICIDLHKIIERDSETPSTLRLVLNCPNSTKEEARRIVRMRQRIFAIILLLLQKEVGRTPKLRETSIGKIRKKIHDALKFDGQEEIENQIEWARCAMENQAMYNFIDQLSEEERKKIEIEVESKGLDIEDYFDEIMSEHKEILRDDNNE